MSAQPDWLRWSPLCVCSPRRGGGHLQRGHRAHRVGSVVTVGRGYGTPGPHTFIPLSQRGRARRGRPPSRTSLSRWVLSVADRAAVTKGNHNWLHAFHWFSNISSDLTASHSYRLIMITDSIKLLIVIIELGFNIRSSFFSSSISKVVFHLLFQHDIRSLVLFCLSNKA